MAMTQFLPIHGPVSKERHSEKAMNEEEGLCPMGEMRYFMSLFCYVCRSYEHLPNRYNIDRHSYL